MKLALRPARLRLSQWSDLLKEKMSLFGKLFKNRKRKSDKISSEEAINNLRDMEAMLIKKQEHFEQKIDTEVALAKKHGQKNQRAALSALRRKKHYESELARIDGVLAKLEGQRQALEDAGTNVEVLNVLGEAGKALKKANMDMDIDKVSDLMDSIAEELQTSNEFQSAISRPIADTADEDDLLKELEQLQEEHAAIPAATLPAALPDVPAGPITRARASRDKLRKQDSEMDALEAWAAAN